MKILIVDDNHDFCTTLADIVHTQGWGFEIRNSPDAALEYLQEHHRSIGLMLLDIEFNNQPAVTGIDVLAKSVRAYPSIPVIMISGKGTIETAVKATKLGAHNFIEKSLLSHDRLKEVLSSAIHKVGLQKDNSELRKLIKEQGIIGTSKPMMEVADKILRYGRTDLNVLVTGETGTGKKLVARAIHAISRRAKNALVTVDIPNIPRELFQSELFGYVRGSFSGARENKRGLFHQAHKGTLFLDEIGDLPAELQANLLLPIEEKVIRRVGATETEEVDLRFVSATDRDLVAAMNEAHFREQLYHRLRECEIHLPPLRERQEDIPGIVEYYVLKHNEEMQDAKAIEPAAVEYLQERAWPGNVRELSSVLKVTLQTTQNEILTVADFANSSAHAPAANGKTATFSTDLNLKDDLARMDRLKLEATLEKCRGNVSKAAAVLDISRETLHNKIRKYDIDVHQFRSKK
jgi:two-component system nitrogen regulation response regulator NtrX